MISYLLDTNIVIAVLNRRSELAIRRLAMMRDEVALPAIVMHELAFGAYNSADPVQNLRKVHGLSLPTLNMTRADAISAGRVRAILKASGMPIGHYDLLIAGQALSRGLTLVTNNTREFARVEGLKLEDWTAA